MSTKNILLDIIIFLVVSIASYNIGVSAANQELKSKGSIVFNDDVVFDAEDLNNIVVLNNAQDDLFTQFQETLSNYQETVELGKILLADTITNKGTTVSSDSSFSDLAENIGTMAGNQYQAGVIAGKAGMYTKAQYDAAYNSGGQAGQAQPKTGTVSIAVQRRPENNYVRIYVNSAEYNIDCGSAGTIKPLSFSYTIN